MIIGEEKKSSNHFLKTQEQAITLYTGRREPTHNQKYSHHPPFINRYPWRKLSSLIGNSGIIEKGRGVVIDALVTIEPKYISDIHHN